jgi:hypothetical protein
LGAKGFESLERRLLVERQLENSGEGGAGSSAGRP